MPSPKIAVFSGSARDGSFNKKVAAIAAKALADQGAEAVLVDLNDYEAPVYHGDVEDASGAPESMKKLAEVLGGCDGFAISTPEYNGFVPPLLVNTFSWLSRLENNPLPGKTAALMAASPGGLGGVRVIPRLRDELAELGVTSLCGFATVGAAYEAFKEDGSFVDNANAEAVAGLMSSLIAAIK